MSYQFEANPKVVPSKSIYRPKKDSGTDTTNDGGSLPYVGKENRVKPLTPAQQEEEYIRLEKDRIKIENMHKQLVTFKNSKKKMSPYDIKPAPNPKVNANLAFFLTDSTDVKPLQTNIDIQTDVFKPRPKSPPYVPKKTGRDVHTQVEDNELFNFDREVTPIIDVIVTKTLEQSVTEIAEEEEIYRIKNFKEGYWKRRQEDEQKWKTMLQKELDTIAVKNKKLEEYRAREEKRIKTLRKLQAYQIAQNYLRDIKFNTMTYYYEGGLYQNAPKEERTNNVPGFLVDGVIKTLGQRRKLWDMVSVAFNSIQGELTSLRENADKKFERRKEKRRLKRINHSKDERFVRFAYLDDSTPSTYFVRFMAKMLDPNNPDLNVFFQDYRGRVNQLKDKLHHDDITKEEYDTTYAAEFPELQTPSNFRLVLNDLQVLSFNVANNMYFQEFSKPGDFDISVSAFDRQGNYLYQVDKTNPRNPSKSLHYLGNIRDSTIKVSDDLGIKINLKKIESEVSHLVLTVEIRNLEQSIRVFNELQHSRFRVADYVTDQTLEDTNIFTNFNLEALRDPAAETELGGKILCYYLYKTPELGWLVESVKSFKNVPVDTYSEFNHTVENYLKVCVDEEFKEFAESPEFTASIQEQQSFDKSRSKDSKGKASVVPSKVVIAESKKEEEEDNKQKFNSRTFGPLYLTVSDDLEWTKERIDETLKKESPDLYESFEYGYEVTVDNVALVRPTQIRKIGAITSFLVKRKPKPVEVPVVQTTDEEDGGDQEDKKSDVSD